MQSIYYRTLPWALAAAFGLLGPQVVWAASPATSAPAASDPFDLFDQNGDKLISLTEFTAKGGQEAVFKANDTNSDGQLSADEVSGTAPPASSKAYK